MTEQTPDTERPNEQPGWVLRSVTLRDHFDDHTTLRVAQPQPQYGTVQLNATFKGELISVDVNADDLLAALHTVMGEPVEPTSPETARD